MKKKKSLIVSVHQTQRYDTCATVYKIIVLFYLFMVGDPCFCRAAFPNSRFLLSKSVLFSVLLLYIFLLLPSVKTVLLITPHIRCSLIFMEKQTLGDCFQNLNWYASCYLMHLYTLPILSAML